MGIFPHLSHCLDGTSTLPFPTETETSRHKDVQFTDNGVTELGCEFLGRTLGPGDLQISSLDVIYAKGESLELVVFLFWCGVLVAYIYNG